VSPASREPGAAPVARHSNRSHSGGPLSRHASGMHPTTRGDRHDPPPRPPRLRGHPGRGSRRRVDDGRGDTSVVYDRDPAPGIWQPPPTGMAAAWLGFVDPIVLDEPVELDGPDALGSAAYAADYEEVRTVGRKTATAAERSEEQTAIARFFATNPIPVYRNALFVRRLVHPVLAAEVRHRVLAPVPGDRRSGGRRQPRHRPGDRVGAARAEPALRRLHQRPRRARRVARSPG